MRSRAVVIGLVLVAAGVLASLGGLAIGSGSLMRTCESIGKQGSLPIGWQLDWLGTSERWKLRFLLHAPGPFIRSADPDDVRAGAACLLASSARPGDESWVVSSVRSGKLGLRMAGLHVARAWLADWERGRERARMMLGGDPVACAVALLALPIATGVDLELARAGWINPLGPDADDAEHVITSTLHESRVDLVTRWSQWLGEQGSLSLAELHRELVVRGLSLAYTPNWERTLLGVAWKIMTLEAFASWRQNARLATIDWQGDTAWQKDIARREQQASRVRAAPPLAFTPRAMLELVHVGWKPFVCSFF